MKKKNLLRGIGCALMLSVLTLSGCGGGDEAGGSDKVTWYLFSSPNNVNEDDVFAQAKQIAKEKINVDLEIVPVEQSNYDAKMQMINASNQECDIVFVSNWLNNYYNNVSQGTLLALDDYLKDMPELYNVMPDYFWKSAKVDGKIYAVPNQQIAARGAAFAIPTQNIDNLGINLDDYKDTDRDYKAVMDQIEKYLKLVKEKTGESSNIGAIWSDGNATFNMEEVVGSKLPGAVFFDDESSQYKVVNQYESEKFKDLIKIRRRWVQEGLTFPAVDTERNLNKVSDPKSTVPYIKCYPSYKPGAISDLNSQSNYTWSILFKNSPIMTNGSICATMTAVNANSKNPKAAMKVIQLANTDPEFYNTLVYGIEGVNYNKTGENRIELNKDAPYTWKDWNVGNTFNKYLLPEEDDDAVEQVKQINDGSFKSPLLGFAPDLSEVKVEVAGCRSAVSEYLTSLEFGLVDVDSSYDEFISKLKSAGADKIISVVQEQLDEWVKNNK